MKPNILIIDDEPEMCWAVAKAMEMEGFTAITANGGQEGLKIFSSEKISVVLVDLKMPDMDGIEVIKELRHVDPEVPVVLITGHGSMDVAHEALSEDATGYIIKPFRMAALRATVKKMINELELQD